MTLLQEGFRRKQSGLLQQEAQGSQEELSASLCEAALCPSIVSVHQQMVHDDAVLHLPSLHQWRPGSSVEHVTERFHRVLCMRMQHKQACIAQRFLSVGRQGVLVSRPSPVKISPHHVSAADNDSLEQIWTRVLRLTPLIGMDSHATGWS